MYACIQLHYITYIKRPIVLNYITIVISCNTYSIVYIYIIYIYTYFDVLVIRYMLRVNNNILYIDYKYEFRKINIRFCKYIILYNTLYIISIEMR